MRAKEKRKARVRFYLDLEKFKISYNNFRSINIKVGMWLNGKVGFYSPLVEGLNPQSLKFLTSNIWIFNGYRVLVKYPIKWVQVSNTYEMNPEPDEY